ncbi:arginine/serine-rich protein PNISR isoform X1 [Hydra vulgaris]|uniref:arginine/serine-rich protein PNISR isoform X1 n=2 Tax=Hydra vulgaris TaxID=6087 RepID=UPI0002B4D986|nr:arginine/serine-rich protein PNISR isoform X1 [Hydra vulgaris]XP_012561475.1 arginine/serine-rich protein PNISR isoform X1 [Hydra vulgaris]XP_047128862.1 arginine/serine-rich protein PNISR isoform X1 [Hydra vulgaris]XP_047128863.1 arginine/serine-rich protein PNISR isoform X1 [Hydra vulgaris]
MWNQSQPLQPNWGWPPNPNYQFNSSQDESQSWAAAAALWVQHKQFQPNNNEGYAVLDKPPEPPGPPPLPPPLPPPEEIPISVVDYNHGQTILENKSDLFQNDLNNKETLSSQVMPGDVFDYNHGKPEESGPDQNWGYNMWAGQQPAQPVPGFYNSDWNQGQWNGDHWENWNDSSAGFHPHPECFDQNSFHPPVFQDVIKPKDIIFNGRPEINSPDPVELAKKGKSLPLWLRQGLEKLGKEKEKQKVKEDLPIAKKISGYQHGSPHSSPEREKQIEPEKAEVTQIMDQEESVSLVSQEVETSPNHKVEEELDEEEKQKQRMLKIKTWMTETLLGVTNDEIQSLCNEVYFEIKKSVKVKATQLRQSGGLEALRSAALGDGDASASDSEEELSSAKEIKPVETIKAPEVNRISPVPIKTPDVPSKAVCSDRREEKLQAEIKSLDILIQARKQQKINAEKNLELKRHKDTVMSKKSRNEQQTSDSDESTSNLRKKRKQSSSSSSESESEESDSSDSETVTKKRKKSKHRQQSPSRHKKSKKKPKRLESSSESDHKKKKRKRKELTSSSDESSHSLRKKKSKGKKHKHKSRSHSRSPKHSKQRR